MASAAMLGKPLIGVGSNTIQEQVAISGDKVHGSADSARMGCSNVKELMTSRFAVPNRPDVAAIADPYTRAWRCPVRRRLKA